jgi:hypothetical protein
MKLARDYMRLAVIIFCILAALEIGNHIATYMKDAKIEEYRSKTKDLEGEIARLNAVIATPPFLNARVLADAPKWEWHWGEGGWETTATFSKNADGTFHFAATTMYRRRFPDRLEERIIEWESNEPIRVDDTSPLVTFRGVRRVVASDSVRESLKLGPAVSYPTKFSLRKSWSLSGSYTGADGSGPAGDMNLYIGGR